MHKPGPGIKIFFFASPTILNLGRRIFISFFPSPTLRWDRGFLPPCTLPWDRGQAPTMGNDDKILPFRKLQASRTIANGARDVELAQNAISSWKHAKENATVTADY